VMQAVFDVKCFDVPKYEVDRSNYRIGYRNKHVISYTASYGYRTAFAYLHEFSSIAKDIAVQQLGLQFVCGHFSFASLPHQFGVILGVTGTLKDLSNFENKAISTYALNKRTYTPSVFGKRKLTFREADDVYVEDNEHLWMHKIQEKIIEGTKDKRAVLVFFEDDIKVQLFMESIYKNGISLLQTLVTTTENIEFTVKKATNSEQVTIASAVFGRGLDFVCHYEPGSTMEKMGVKVIQTFLSESITEEIQIKGRTARQGQCGSYELVLCTPHLATFGITELQITEQRKFIGQMYSYLNMTRNEHFETTSNKRMANVDHAAKRDQVSIAYLDSLVNYDPKNRPQIIKALISMHNNT